MEGKKETYPDVSKEPYPLYAAPRPYSFELNEDMIRLLRAEFDPPKVVEKLVEAIRGKKGKEVEEIGAKVFAEYGRDWMKKVMQLGEEYSDRTYDVLKAAADRTGELYFPHVPQRFIEIAYLSTQQSLTLPVVESWRRRLIYRVPNCYTFKTVKERCGEVVANLLLCKSACLAGLETLVQDLNLDVSVGMEAETPKNGFCQFALRKG